MVEARAESLWDHTSHVLWIVASVNRASNARAPKPSDFHPYARRQQREKPVATIKMKDAKELLMGLAPRKAV